MSKSRTGIIATLGPASSEARVIRKMMREGLDVVRLNFSHGTHESHFTNINTVRELNKKCRRSVKILQDLEGFRIRIGKFRNGGTKELKKRAVVTLSAGADTGDPCYIPFDYKRDLSAIKKGQYIFIDDGNLILKVKGSSKRSVAAEVVEGGVLKERKGVNIPDSAIPFVGMTRKDKDDLEFGIEQKVDYVAQSFVRTAKDVEEVRKIVARRLPLCRIIAKIEAREAIKNIDEIIDASDGIMIARGDMGIAVPIFEIPIIQKLIIKKCNKKKKFVITATQMLEHMTEHSRPTRAEVNDVANAILEGTDYCMLSAESASGSYPVESVAMMHQIIKFTENYRFNCYKGGKFLKYCL